MSIERLKEVHTALERMVTETLDLFKTSDPEIFSSSTVFALGEAAGILSKARSMVGRDIDDARRDEETE